ncbi:PepSY-like domain-containing protein [Myroides odoratus]|uniref:PepSY-like domain-containing protein n=1 Tax=Myroides odoratus TaxID=256 RepID=UPI0039B04D9C
MRKFRALLVGIFSVFALLTSGSVNAKDVLITKSELPQKAIVFLDNHFKNKQILTVEKDSDFLSLSYKVTFTDNIEVEFDKSGDWDEIDGNRNALPTTFILEPIVSYISTNYKGATITKIDKESRIYEVKLNNGLELEFSTSGVFKRIDN